MSSFLRLESAPEMPLPGRGGLRALSAADPAVLLEIMRPGIGLSVWAREPDAGWIPDAAMLRPPPGGLVFTGEASVVARALAMRLPGGCPDWFALDVARQARLLAVLADERSVVLRFGAPPPEVPPETLRLCCRYGPGGLDWSHPGPDGGDWAGGGTEPFAVLILKGARSAVLRRETLRLAAGTVPFPQPDSPQDPGPILVIEPVPTD